MKRTIVRPAALDLESPGRRDYFVALEHDSIWGDHLIPLTVAVGHEAEAGRGMVAFGSTHGNEYEGPVAIKHMMADLDMASVRGRLILVPVLNPAAFRAGARDSVADDGVNLNRAFVEGAGRPPLGGISHRIAAFVRETIWPHVHIVLDLHAGGEVGRFAPGPSYHACENPDRDRLTEQIARWFGTKIVIVLGDSPILTPGGIFDANAVAAGDASGIDVAAVSTQLPRAVAGVSSVHHVHAWSLTPGDNLLTLHAVLAPEADADLTLNAIRNWLRSNYRIGHATVQVERSGCDDAAGCAPADGRQ